MFRKLAFQNVKKSMKDYTIYFLTLVFGVCLFYVFNSMESQEKMLKLSESSHEVIQMLTSTMGYVSIFISIILAFLVLYANTFLIKRRKKELGLYMCLGMNRRKISQMLIYETLCIGIVALVIGIVAGTFLAQGLAVVTARMMEVELAEFTFTFSGAAALKAIVYFGIIFLVVMLFNTVAISRYKLIDLLTAGRKNEKDRSPKLGVSVVLFLISLGLIGTAYYMLYQQLTQLILSQLGILLVVGAVGTVLFFYAMSGFVLKIMRHFKSTYYKGINMFVMRQINSKLSSTFVSMSIICLMLLIAITMMAAGLGFSNVMTRRKDQLVPCDNSYIYYEVKEDKLTPLETYEKSGIDLSAQVKGVNEVNVYSTEEFMLGSVLDKAKVTTDEVMSYIRKAPVNLVKLSEYNRERKFEGKKELALQMNQCAFLTTIDAMGEVLDEVIESDITVPFCGQELDVNKELIRDSICNEMIGNTPVVMIVPDELLEGKKLTYEQAYLNMNYVNGSEKLSRIVEEKMDEVFHYQDNKKLKHKMTKYTTYNSRVDIRVAQVGIRVVASFFILYVGIIFLISCAAILALQQLSESSDNVERYQLLKKLGVEDKMMKSAIFRQVGVYFLVPLAIAVIHSAVAIRFTTKLFALLGETSVGNDILMVAIFLIVIYGGYFIATYIGSKNIIREK